VVGWLVFMLHVEGPKFEFQHGFWLCHWCLCDFVIAWVEMLGWCLEI